MAQFDNSKTTVNFTNEILNDSITFDILRSVIIAYKKQDLEQYYLSVRSFYNHIAHFIINEKNKDKFVTIRKTLSKVGHEIKQVKASNCRQLAVKRQEKLKNSFSDLENIELYLKQELHRIKYFKKTTTTSTDFMDKYLQEE